MVRKNMADYEPEPYDRELLDEEHILRERASALREFMANPDGPYPVELNMPFIPLSSMQMYIDSYEEQADELAEDRRRHERHEEERQQYYLDRKQERKRWAQEDDRDREKRKKPNYGPYDVKDQVGGSRVTPYAVPSIYILT
jgi:hypothetical protein